jgi:hypothetical protein
MKYCTGLCVICSDTQTRVETRSTDIGFERALDPSGSDQGLVIELFIL